MSNHSQNNGILPPNEDKTPNTRQLSECSPNFYQAIFKASFPYHQSDMGVDISLTDTHALLLDSVIGQVELLSDLGNKISGNEDIAGFGLVGFANGLRRQLKVLDVIQTEYYTQVGKLKGEHKKALSEYERVMHEDATKIKELERTIAMLKGGAV